MNIVVLNGSPRKGNTLTAIEAFRKGAEKKHNVEIVDTYQLNVGPCMGCGACEMHKGCVAKDDSNMIVDKIVAADVLVFATPVYWWGMTAQLKMILDKCYCKGIQLKGKKAGVIVVGGSPVEHKQYQIIRDQFDCIKDCLGWDILFHKSYYASAKDDLAKNTEALNELELCAEQI